MSWINIKIWTISNKFHYPYEWILSKSSGPRYITKEITWNWYVNLTNAVANYLIELKVYWWTEQDWTPTPTSPIDIVSNNWAIKVSKNLLDMSEENIVMWKYIDNSWVVQNSTPNFYNSKYISVIGGETYTRSTSENVRYVSIMEYDINKTFIQRTLFSNGTSWKNSWSLILQNNTAFILFGSNPFAKDIVIDDVFSVKRQFEKWDTATTYREYWKIYTDWTIETIKDGLNNTATAEMLLEIWADKDEQRILSWVIIRNIWIKVLDWTENWTKESSALWNIYNADILDNNMFNWLVCTHFTNNSPLTDNIIYKSAGSSILQIRYDTATNLEEFKNFLSMQYSNNTPVILLYTLETPISETVDWQEMNIPEWNSTIEITQASIEDLPLYAKYKATA